LEMEAEEMTPELAENISQFYQQQHQELIGKLAVEIALMSKQEDGPLRLQWFTETIGAMLLVAVESLPDADPETIMGWPVNMGNA